MEPSDFLATKGLEGVGAFQQHIAVVKTAHPKG
jgi:hypothetical protein